VVSAEAGKPGAKAVAEAKWIKRNGLSSRTLLDKLPAKLHLGEREAIALAYELGGTLLVDEREARREALRLGIAHFGSLRILKELKDRRVIPAVKPILDELVQSGTYLGPDLYRDFLRRLNEA
jgi:predicted nucleic acid-binding protein